MVDTGMGLTPHTLSCYLFVYRADSSWVLVASLAGRVAESAEKLAQDAGFSDATG